MIGALDFSTPHVLRDEAEYDQAIAEIDALLDRDPPAGSADHDRLEFLSVLVEWMGGRSRMSEFFSGKRALSKGQIEALREKLGLSADVLMG